MKTHPTSASDHGEGMPSAESRLFAEYGMASGSAEVGSPIRGDVQRKDTPTVPLNGE